MFSWFKKSRDYIKVMLPGEVGHLEIPADYEDDQSTLVFCSPKMAAKIVFRVSSFTGVPKPGVEGLTEERIGEIAAESGSEVKKQGEKVFCHCMEEADEDGTTLDIHFWHIGFKQTMVVLSATVVQESSNTGAVQKELAEVPRMIETLQITKERVVYVNEEGSFEATVGSGEPIKDSRRELNKEEEKWVKESLERAAKLSMRYGSGGTLDPAQLDAIFSRWKQEREKKESAQEVVDGLGAAFGQFLVESTGFGWRMITDQYGTEYAVEHPNWELTTFPRTVVEKRIESGEEDFFRPIHHVITEEMKKIAVEEKEPLGGAFKAE